MTQFEGFTNLYQVSKTLRFELIPQGKTLKHIQEQGFIEEDKARNDHYKELKPIIDRIYKTYADQCLQLVQLDWENLSAAIDSYRKEKTEETRNALIEEQATYRNAIHDYFIGRTDNLTDAINKRHAEIYKGLFKAELFNGKVLKQLGTVTTTEHENALLRSFDKFTTYFSGFYENRKNVFSAEDISTAIPHRIVQDNFPKFKENCHIFTRLITAVPSLREHFENVKKAIGIFVSTSIEEVFSFPFYNQLLTQTQIDLYNQLLGGISREAGTEKIKGLNEVLNLAIQKNDETAHIIASLPHRFIPLFKQILSDRNTLSFILEEFKSDEEVIQSFCKYKTLLRNENVLETAEALFNELNSIDLTHIFISHKKLETISSALCDHWDTLRNALYERRISELTGKITKSAKEKVQRSLKHEDINLQEIISAAGKELSEAFKQKTSEILSHAHAALDQPLPTTLKKQEEKEILKSQLDSLLGLYHLLDWFAVDESNEVDPEFSARLTGIKLEMEPSLSFYNKARNYATKKPYSVEKFKLNFQMPTLASGWDVNKEKNNGAILFVKNGLYYLGIMPKQKGRYKALSFEPTEKTSEGFDKMYYDYFPDAAKMIPKCSTQLKAVTAHFQTHTTPILLSNNFIEPLEITKEIYDLNNPEKEPKKFQTAYAKKTGDQKGYREALCKWIDFTRDYLSKYTKTTSIDLSSLRPSSQYKDLGEYYAELNPLLYHISFQRIAEKEIMDAVETGKLYLFQIYNKDFAKGHHGKPNLHTLYWTGLFSPENLAKTSIKLNGQAELFYRPKSRMKRMAHRLGEKMLNKKLKDQKTPIPDTLYQELYDYVNHRLSHDLSDEARALLPNVITKEVSHEIIKDRRFTSDKFFFHVPITLNYQAANSPSKFNQRVNAYLKEHPETPIIGIDRGERNLIYITVIDSTGKILEQRSLNTIQQFDYQKKLDNREKERVAARQAWSVVGTIKDLKQGYLSQVIHEIVDLMIHYQAVVVLENLNFGFKSKRTGIAEKAVYQQFEKMLIDKLNCLVLKDYPAEKVGGVLNPYQLTDQFTSFAKMGTQSGFLFYVPAPYTSKIDPLTGFVDPFVWKTIKNHESRKHFLEGFDFLHYDVKTGDFILHFKMNRNLSFQRGLPGFMPAWDIVFEKNETQFDAKGTPFIAGKRIVPVIENHRFTGRYRDLYPANELIALLEEKGIVFRDGSNILPKLLENDDSHAIDTMVALIRSVLQMRNSNAATGEDYINSPVRDLNGVCFDSRFQNPEWPMDADANGAYHIALKGQLLLNHLKESKDLKLQNGISNQDWLAYIQELRN